MQSSIMMLFRIAILISVAMVPGTALQLDDKDWHVVFRVASGVEFPDAHDLWESNSFIVSLNENIADAKALTGSFPGHYKSSWISEWTSLGVTEVKLALYAQDGEELIAFTFSNTIDNSKGGWFSADNLLEISPYLNATENVGDHIFLSGFEANSESNRLIIRSTSSFSPASSSSERCRDIGWLTQINGNDIGCRWEEIGLPRPFFIYSRKSTSAQWPAWIQDNDVECYTDQKGRDYRGFVSVTESGRTCQLWTVDEPHEHDRSEDNYPEGGVSDHNFCRNPDGGEQGPWCYTTDPDKRWELCDVGARRRGCGRYFDCQMLGSNWRYWNQSCYLFMGSRYTGDDAETNCKSRHAYAHLAVANSEEELFFIRSLLPNSDRHNTWLGCRDVEENGKWTCADHNEVNEHVYNELDGSSVGFWYWDNNMPSGANEYCLASGENMGRFHDWSCNSTSAKHRSICEVPISYLETKYIGCFVDNGNRILQGGRMDSAKMTLQLCFDFCTSLGMAYAGVEYENECFCGPEDVDLSNYGPRNEGECSLRCSGDQTQFCGDGYRLNIYDITRDDEIGFGNALVISVKLKPSPIVSNCPEDIIIVSDISNDENDSEDGTQVSWTEPSVEDLTTTSISQTHLSGSSFPDGLTEVTYTFTHDVTMNSTTCSFDVNVLGQEDITAANQVARNAAISLGLILLVVIAVIVGIVVILFMRWRRNKESEENREMEEDQNDNVYTNPGGPTTTANGNAVTSNCEDDVALAKHKAAANHLNPEAAAKRVSSVTSTGYQVPLGAASSSGTPAGKVIDEDTYEELGQREPTGPYTGLHLKEQEEFIYEEPKTTVQDDYINVPRTASFNGIV